MPLVATGSSAPRPRYAITVSYIKIKYFQLDKIDKWTEIEIELNRNNPSEQAEMAMHSLCQ